MKFNFSKIVNVILLILFVILAVNSTIIHFHLSENMGQVVSLYKKVGWSFLLFLLVHILLHLNYYKNIFRE
jgi:hypothetical protein